MVDFLTNYFFTKSLANAIFWPSLLFAGVYFLTRSRSSLSMLIFISLLVEMVFVSLHFTAKLNNIVILKDVSFQVINFALMLLWLARIFEKDGFVFARTPMNIPVFLFFWACVIGSYWSPRIFWYYSVEWASRYGASVAMFYLIVNFITTRSRWNISLYTFLAMMVITSIYAIMQVEGYDFMSWGRIVNVSTFGNKDFFASFLTYSTPIALFMAIGSKNIFDGILYMAMFLVGFYNIWTGETRGAWVGLMALAPVVFLFECKFGRLRKWLGDWKTQAIIWSVVLVIVIIISPFVMSEHRVETVKSIFQFEKGTNIIRVYMWWTAVRMIWDQPILGQGLGASHVTYPFFRPDRYHRIGMSHNTDYVHSEELQFLCEQGIIGFSTWLAMLVVFFYICYRKMKTLDDISERYLLFGLAGSFFAAIVHDSMNVNLRWTSSMIAFWFVMAMGTRYVMGFEAEPDSSRAAVKDARRRREPALMDSRTYAFFPVILAGFAFMYYGQYRVLRGDWALKTTEESGGSTAITKGLDTLEYNPYSHSAYYKVAFHYLNENRVDKALETYDRLLNIAPNYAQTHQNTGLIYYRLFVNSNQRKYLYQAILEFEWATTLENNFENHTKLLQLYNQLMNDSSRGRYHNQFLFWNALEDSYFVWSRYWDMATAAHQNDAGRRAGYEEWCRPLIDAGRDYWLYRTDTVRRVGRPRDEVRYAMKMSVRYHPQLSNLLQFSLGTLLPNVVNSEGDLLYMINIVDHLERSEAPPGLMLQTRQSLMQTVANQPPRPLLAYALGVLSYKGGDMPAAAQYFQLSRQMEGDKHYSVIRDGLRKYKL